jgi:hypothetical protein
MAPERGLVSCFSRQSLEATVLSHLKLWSYVDSEFGHFGDLQSDHLQQYDFAF